MPKYKVYSSERVYFVNVVEAESEEEAMFFVEDGKVLLEEPRYSGDFEVDSVVKIQDETS